MVEQSLTADELISLLERLPGDTKIGWRCGGNVGTVTSMSGPSIVLGEQLLGRINAQDQLVAAIATAVAKAVREAMMFAPPIPPDNPPQAVYPGRVEGLI
jgi:hypothetical protein